MSNSVDPDETARERSELYGREYDQGKVSYNDIYFQQKSLWPNFLPFSSRKLSPEVGRTGADLIIPLVTIWVSLISGTKWQETSVNKSHEHIFADCFYYLLFIYFLCTDIHSLMMLWRTFEETTDMSVLCSHLG